MPVSRQSFRRVIGDFVQRYQSKSDSISSSSNERSKTDRNSMISSDSISFAVDSNYERLYKTEREFCKSLNYLEQVLQHKKFEILANIITSLIENALEIDQVLQRIFQNQSEAFRIYLLTHVYSLLADLIDWADQLLFPNTQLDANDNAKQRQIAKELINAVQVCVSLVCNTSSIPGEKIRSESLLSFSSTNNSIDEFVPSLPAKREKRSISSSARLKFVRSRTEIDEDEIQSIVDDIQQIIDDYTRELDETIQTKHLDESKMSLVPPLPPKRDRTRAYMSLFDRYDQNQSQTYLHNEYFPCKTSRRFEELFPQSLRKEKLSNDNLSIDRLFTQEKATGQPIEPNLCPIDDLFLENVSHLLVFNSNEDPPLRGGTIEALIIRATSSDKKDFLYQEAFLTTYRTFISPTILIEKLIERYEFFVSTPLKKKIARSAFSLLIRVIDEIDNEMNENLMKILSKFVTNLIRNGDLQLAKVLRRTSIDRFVKMKKNLDEKSTDIVFIRNSISSKRATLLDFHSVEISEQLTLLDSELFLRIFLSEILYTSIEKNDEFSTNLVAFTEHFNNISYWVRSRILEQNSQRQRENYFEKFLKILKHLRRLNNFNSYLAILSALDCGPLKRLDWSKNISDAVAEHTDLIDSTGSFKAYREAFNSSIGQPCIPYIGLILSDLTFIHIGNADFLQDQRVVNFWKRWQQFTILHKLRYCRKWEYKFTRNDRILYFFNNFDDFMNEEAQWIQSEKIKPRPKTTSLN